MSEIAEGFPCQPWPVNTDCMGLPAGTDQDLIDRWAAVATQVLWALSGRRWGPCPVTVRPCMKRTLISLGLAIDWPGQTGQYVPYTIGGRWYNANVCACSGDCSCTEICEVHLTGPVHDITSVKLDGAVVDPNDYRVDAGGKLIRLNGGCWPSCQNMSLAGTEVGTFEIVYSIGLPLNEVAIAAVSELTGELIKACLPDVECKLPRRVTQINRAGMVAQFIDPQTFLKDGRTGLYLVDLWLESVNPKSLPSPSRVMSPDAKPPRQLA